MIDEYIPLLDKTLSIHEIDTTYNKKSFMVLVGNEKRFEVNQLVASLINIIDGVSNICSITRKFNDENSKNYSEEEITKIIDTILKPKKIVVDDSIEDHKIEEKKIKTYLWFRLNLLNEKNVNAITTHIRTLFSPPVMITLLTLSAFIHFVYYFYIMKPTYIDIDIIFTSKLLIMYLLVNIDSIVHELGHATALRYYNQNPRSIGIGIYMFMIVLFADVTNAWKLNRKQRTVVNTGGFFFELLVLNLIFGLYFITNDIILLVTFFAIDIKLLVGLNPFFRFDGYWIATDIIGITNLRDKSKQVLKYFINHITHKTYPTPNFWEKLNFRTKIVLSIYSLLSLFFFTYVGWRLVEISYFFLLNLDQELIGFWNMINKNFSFQQFSITGAFLFGKIITVLFTFITLLKLIWYSISLIKKRRLNDT